MKQPIIAIVGSADPKRTDYNPRLKNLQHVEKAAEELGCELAKAGYQIMVYSANPVYIESQVVKGYVESNAAAANSIQVRYPRGADAESHFKFKEQNTHSYLFDLKPDIHANWEVSFYQSLKEADGVLILGGASSALITGLMSRLLQLAIIPIATFGGSAENVWILMDDLANVSREEHNLLGRATWETGSAAALVTALTQQRKRILERREQERLALQSDERATRRRSVLVGGLFALAVALVVGGMATTVNGIWFGLLFFATPMVAGAAGGVARNVWDLFQGSAIPAGRSEAPALVLGMIGGSLSAILFALSQWATMPNTVQQSLATLIPQELRTLLVFELVIGFTAGLTTEVVFNKLRGTEVLNTAPLKPTPP